MTDERADVGDFQSDVPTKAGLYRRGSLMNGKAEPGKRAFALYASGQTLRNLHSLTSICQHETVRMQPEVVIRRDSFHFSVLQRYLLRVGSTEQNGYFNSAGWFVEYCESIPQLQVNG